MPTILGIKDRNRKQAENFCNPAIVAELQEELGRKPTSTECYHFWVALGGRDVFDLEYPNLSMVIVLVVESVPMTASPTTFEPETISKKIVPEALVPGELATTSAM